MFPEYLSQNPMSTHLRRRHCLTSVSRRGIPHRDTITPRRGRASGRLKARTCRYPSAPAPAQRLVVPPDGGVEATPNRSMSVRIFAPDIPGPEGRPEADPRSAKVPAFAHRFLRVSVAPEGSKSKGGYNDIPTPEIDPLRPAPSGCALGCLQGGDAPALPGRLAVSCERLDPVILQRVVELALAEGSLPPSIKR